MKPDARLALHLFDGGPALGVQRRLRLLTPERPRTLMRMALVAALGWLPVVLIGAFAGCDGAYCQPWFDFSLCARSLVAAPLLILAESACSPRLGAIACQFAAADLIPAGQEQHYRDAVQSTLRWRDSRVAGLLIVLCAYSISVGLALTVPAEVLPAWHITLAADAHSPAGWWHLFVSLPLLLALLLGWLWRLLLWTRFLCRVARLDLRLIAAHPDLAAGLKFVGYSARAFAPLGFACGVIGAGTMANGMVYAGLSAWVFVPLMLGLGCVVLVLFAGPTLVFVGPLLRAWRRGVFDEGTLINRVGHQFERKWIALGEHQTEDPLAVHDFSATNDLFQLAANIYAMRLTPLDLKSLAGLVVATLLPFLPALLLIIPVSEILSVLVHLLF